MHSCSLYKEKNSFGPFSSPALNPQILREKMEAAQHISESLSEKVEAVCLEECLSFLQR